MSITTRDMFTFTMVFHNNVNNDRGYDTSLLCICVSI